VTVVDTTPPRVTCPGDMSVQTTNAAGAAVTYIASAADPCGLASFDCSPRSGSAFSVGMTPVTCAATDSVGNANSCSFQVTITLSSAPVITCPPGVEVQCTGGLTPATY